MRCLRQTPDIVVKGALSPEEVAAANAVLDERSAETLEISKAARAKEEHLQDNPLHWGPVFRGLLDNPRLTPILEELIGAHAGSRCELPRVPRRLAAPALVSCSCLIAQCHVQGPTPPRRRPGCPRFASTTLMSTPTSSKAIPARGCMAASKQRTVATVAAHCLSRFAPTQPSFSASLTQATVPSACSPTRGAASSSGILTRTSTLGC